ncbi:flavodoxin domain-containing protein [Echinimonas agarilytica]|uniref:Flavodoxin domain-containing protein n=1 Tax=Echinimonas agarilytica TaxID=1215918 RepID=A0AA42B6T1_9GAMM|nr:flavodoxin domain-containing protein [Echinimonas agarilytica]MCM2679119.1 flavodoxin domain-containing protein [Echinimonas agarilytica]
MNKLAIIVGSVFGGASALAEEIGEMASHHGVEYEVLEDPTLAQLEGADFWLFVTSTTGQGDVPPNLEPFVEELREQFPMLGHTQTSILALGDSSYSDSFCGAGKQVQELLEELGSNQVLEMLKIDACEYFEPLEGAKKWLDELFEHA